MQGVATAFLLGGRGDAIEVDAIRVVMKKNNYLTNMLLDEFKNNTL